MNASPLLVKIARTLHMVRLETVMVGNAAAALHGAPVTTLDIDFMFRKTPTNMRKLKALKKESERNLVEQIRRQLALPMNRRTNFLRKRLPGGGSSL